MSYWNWRLSTFEYKCFSIYDRGEQPETSHLILLTPDYNFYLSGNILILLFILTLFNIDIYYYFIYI